MAEETTAAGKAEVMAGEGAPLTDAQRDQLASDLVDRLSLSAVPGLPGTVSLPPSLIFKTQGEQAAPSSA